MLNTSICYLIEFPSVKRELFPEGGSSVDKPAVVPVVENLQSKWWITPLWNCKWPVSPGTIPEYGRPATIPDFSLKWSGCISGVSTRYWNTSDVLCCPWASQDNWEFHSLIKHLFSIPQAWQWSMFRWFKKIRTVLLSWLLDVLSYSRQTH